MESGASPNPCNSAEELTGYPARRDKRVAAGTLVPGPITRRETAVCHKWHVRWCVRGRKPPTRLPGNTIFQLFAVGSKTLHPHIGVPVQSHRGRGLAYASTGGRSPCRASLLRLPCRAALTTPPTATQGRRQPPAAQRRACAVPRAKLAHCPDPRRIHPAPVIPAPPPVPLSGTAGAPSLGVRSLAGGLATPAFQRRARLTPRGSSPSRRPNPLACGSPVPAAPAGAPGSAPPRRWRGSAPRAAAGGGLNPVATLPRWCAGDHSAAPLTRYGS